MINFRGEVVISVERGDALSVVVALVDGLAGSRADSRAQNDEIDGALHLALSGQG